MKESATEAEAELTQVRVHDYETGNQHYHIKDISQYFFKLSGL